MYSMFSLACVAVLVGGMESHYFYHAIFIVLMMEILISFVDLL